MNLWLIDLRNIYLNTNMDIRFSDEATTKVRNLLANDNNRILFFGLDEAWHPDAVNLAIKFFNISYNQSNVRILIDRLSINDDPSSINFYKVIPYDSQLMKTAIWQERTANTEINLTTNKFLYLMGKPYKKHRIGVLYELYKADLLKQCDWSFVYDNGYRDSTKQHLDMSDKEFDNFVNLTTRKLDSINLALGNFYHYNGFPTDIKLYQNTSFSLISESIGTEPPHWFLSEKTWRAISNRHMFVTVSNKPKLDFLESLGFDTFQSVLLYNKYWFDTNDVDKIINYTVGNINHLLYTINDNQECITQSIEHNFQIYRKLVDNTRSIISKSLEDYLYITDTETDVHYYDMRELEVTEEEIQKIWQQ